MNRSALTPILFATLVSACALPGELDEPQPELAETTSAVTMLSGPVAQMTGATLDQQKALAKANGYRPISISAYGAPGAERYAAVFVLRSGPAWEIVRGTGHAAFSTAFSTMAQAGYKPVKLSYEGSASNPIWAAVFEKTSGPIPYTRHNLVSGDGSSSAHIQYWLDKAVKEKLMPSTYAIYGSAADPRYAIVLEPNRDNTLWSLGRMSWDSDTKLWNGAGLNDTSGDYVARFNAHTPTGTRPAGIGVTGDGRYASLWREDSVGGYVTKIELTYDQLTAEIAAQDDYGRLPILIEGRGSATSPRFSAIFAATDIPLARVFSSVGSGTYRDGAIPAVDAVFQQFMAANDVRNAGLAVLDGSRLVYARGYNFTEPGTRKVTPTSYFRLASISKTVTALEIMKLQDENQFGPLGLDTPVQSILQLTPWDGSPVPEYFDRVTIKNLLQHTIPHPMGDGATLCLKRDAAMDKGAADAMGVSLPLTTTQAVRYALTADDLLTEKLASGPCYSNLGYYLLGLVIEKSRNAPLETVLQDDLFGPAGITRFRVGHQDPTRADEPVYRTHLLSSWGSEWEHDGRLTAAGYSRNYGAMLAGGGMSFAPVDLARLFAAATAPSNPLQFETASDADDWTGFAVEKMYGNMYGLDTIQSSLGRSSRTKNGGLSGLSSVLSWEYGGLTYVVMFARSGMPNTSGTYAWDPKWDTLVTALQSVDLSVRMDLFPTYGMPAL